MYFYIVLLIFGLQWQTVFCIQQTNLIFIMYDDLRTELTPYGKDYMITPNFDRLAKQSVVFDYAFAQIAVCNPSRDSLMTGLRPDTTGTYGFQSSFRPHRVFPSELIHSGYNTAGYGKIFHWEADDSSIWNFAQWDNDWYSYQAKETRHMNSSTMPDKITPEDKFRDHLFASKAIETLNQLVKQSKYFMLGVGFKLPHLAVHVPHRYYNMYKGKQHNWKLSRRESRFPLSSPDVAYRCCANPNFEFMNEEGSRRHTQSVPLGDINFAFTEKMRDELMMGYCAAITYVDYQLGRILDEIDKLGLWSNTTVILTADHGMHNGEKGIWEKWSLFDESTRVPLFISHPDSPNKGKHFSHPVELIDIYPTVKDILGAKFDSPCPSGGICHPLQGKSLANIVLAADGTQLAPPGITTQHKRGDKTKAIRVRKPVSEAQPEPAVIGLRRQLGSSQSQESQESLGEIDLGTLRQQVSQLQEELQAKKMQSAQSNAGQSALQGSFNRFKSWFFGEATASSVNPGPEPSSYTGQTTVPPPSVVVSVTKVIPKPRETSKPVNNLRNNTTTTRKNPLVKAVAANSASISPATAISTTPNTVSGPKSTKQPQISTPTTASNIQPVSTGSNLTQDAFYAISQSWRCAPLNGVKRVSASLEVLARLNGTAVREGKFRREQAGWYVCDVNSVVTDEVSVMGYSMRTSDFRYTAWFSYNRQMCSPILDSAPLFEEYYDHRGERLEDATHLETRNLLGLGVGSAGNRHKGEHMARDIRDKLVNIIRSKFVFRGCFKA